MIPEILKAKGLICFKEITDYSILGESKSYAQKRKRDDAEQASGGGSAKKKKKQNNNAKLTTTKGSKVTKEKTTKKNDKKPKSKNALSKVKKAVDVQKTTPAKKKKKTTTPKTQKAETVTGTDVDQQKKKAKMRRSKMRKEKKAKRDAKKASETKPTSRKSRLQQPNSTSRMSLHTTATDNDGAEQSESDQNEIEQKMSAWSDMMLPKVLLRGLYDKGFYEPMPIQKLVLPAAIKNKANIIGTAQTGSGKTLAFGLPILTQLIDSYRVSADTGAGEPPAGPQALILTPTRELAIQIKDHLQVACKYQKTKIVVVVGGISQMKQERLLIKKPEIVVATPGRLMQLIDEGNEYLNALDRIRYLVIDEADRMIEKGHFGEMEKILALVNSDEKATSKRQNFLFSATLITRFAGSFEDEAAAAAKSDKQLQREQKQLLDSLVDKIHMSREPLVFDLTTQAITADNLTESKIFCSLVDKDAYLYYFMCKYAGRTLVFANSIDCVRRLTNLFRLLKRSPLHLHANMNQKQRLKNLEKFNAEENSCLIASDVASRGLDIPSVMHVIHYQVPRSAEIYVHRSGRTARGTTNEGLSVMLVAPEEVSLYKKIVKTFRRGTGGDIKDYPIDNDYFDECRSRVALARRVDSLEHQLNKERSNTNWYEKHAKMLDLELDDEIVKETHVEVNEAAKNKQRLRALKTELDKKLAKAIYPKNMSRKYLQRSNVDRVLNMNKANQSALEQIKEAETSKQKANATKRKNAQLRKTPSDSQNVDK